MADSHIHRDLTPSQLAERNAAIVSDYAGGMRSRGIREKYRVCWELVQVILKNAGVAARKGGSRIWVNRRVRPTDSKEVLCSRCATVKLIEEFPPTGIVCRCCVNGRLAVWRDENRDEINYYTKEWVRAKKKRDPQYRAICALKARLVRVLGASGKKKSKASVTKFLGISRNGFVAHIESLMLPGMTWQNRSVGVWHLDHIIPCSAFDHTNPRQVMDCWHYTNLRPLWGPENLRKYNKILVDCLIGPKISSIVTGEKSLA